MIIRNNLVEKSVKLWVWIMWACIYSNAWVEIFYSWENTIFKRNSGITLLIFVFLPHISRQPFVELRVSLCLFVEQHIKIIEILGFLKQFFPAAWPPLYFTLPFFQIKIFDRLNLHQAPFGIQWLKILILICYITDFYWVLHFENGVILDIQFHFHKLNLVMAVSDLFDDVDDIELIILSLLANV